jgi:hypothetical protein
MQNKNSKKKKSDSTRGQVSYFPDLQDPILFVLPSKTLSADAGSSKPYPLPRPMASKLHHLDHSIVWLIDIKRDSLTNFGIWFFWIGRYKTSPFLQDGARSLLFNFA